jgi:hypothetical protein
MTAPHRTAAHAWRWELRALFLFLGGVAGMITGV